VTPSGFPCDCTEVIAMDEDPAVACAQEGSSLVRVAELVRDGRASAMVSAATPGPRWLLRCWHGRCPGSSDRASPLLCPARRTRPSWSTPGPTPSHSSHAGAVRQMGRPTWPPVRHCLAFAVCFHRGGMTKAAVCQGDPRPSSQPTGWGSRREWASRGNGNGFESSQPRGSGHCCLRRPMSS